MFKKYGKDFLEEWAQLSLNQDIIAPKNSSRKNHRQDQSILTMLIYKNGLHNFITKTYKIFGITIHNDPKKIYFWPINKNLEVEKWEEEKNINKDNIDINTIKENLEKLL